MAETTICLEVEGTSPVPSYITDAIDMIQGYPVKLIVVCDGASTHEPGALLDKALCEQVNAVSAGRTLWHPISKQHVMSKY